jgi:hypothetical protein
MGKQTSKGVGHRHLCVAETQRQAEQWEGFVAEGERLQCALTRGCWGEAVGRLIGSGAPSVIG